MKRNEKIRYARLCREAEDQWEFALSHARNDSDQAEPALTEQLVRYTAISQIAAVAKEMKRPVRVYHGWEVMDESSVMTESHEGLILADAAVTDRSETCLVLAPFNQDVKPSAIVWVVAHYEKIWKIEIDWGEEDNE